MDPVTIGVIATSAVSLLSPYLKKVGTELGKTAETVAWKCTTDVFHAIQAKFASSTEAKGALDNLAKKPEDKDTQEATKSQLVKTMTDDESFAKQLIDLLEKADRAGVDSVFNTTIHGDVTKLVNIGVVYGTVNI